MCYFLYFIITHLCIHPSVSLYAIIDTTELHLIYLIIFLNLRILKFAYLLISFVNTQHYRGNRGCFP